MKPRNRIEEAIEVAKGNVERVRIEMICPRFSSNKLSYRIKYDVDRQSIYVLDPHNENFSYRYNVSEFEHWKNINVIVLTEEDLKEELAAIEKQKEKMKELKTFTFKDFIGNDNTIEDVIVCYENVEYTLRPVFPSMFDASMKKGTSGKIHMNDGEVEHTSNLGEIQELVRNGEATVKLKK